MKKLNQKGLGTVEIIIVIVIVGLLGGVGWYVWKQNKKEPAKSSANTSTSSTTETNTSTTKEPIQQKFEIPDGWVTYKNTSYDYRISFPEKYKAWSQDIDSNAPVSEAYTVAIMNKNNQGPVVATIEVGLSKDTISSYKNSADLQKLYNQGIEVLAAKSQAINASDPNPYVKNKTTSLLQIKKRGDTKTYEFTVTGSFACDFIKANDCGMIVDKKTRIVYFQSGENIMRIYFEDNAFNNKIVDTLNLK